MCLDSLAALQILLFDLPLLDIYAGGAKAKRDLLEQFEASIYRCDSTVKAATA